MTSLTYLLLTSLIPHVILELSEDGRLDFTGLTNKYGYNCEEYTVITEDGYILKLFHIPGNSRRPILLMHGYIDSADTFMIRGNKSLVAFLANQGYDIWAGNVRGNHYSRSHIQLDPDSDKEFWNYSYQEIGYYDLPAIIDFVLSKTKEDKLNAIGHSQGNTIFYVLGSTKPEYNDKVNILIALGPVGYLNNLPSPWDFITRALNVLDPVLMSLDTEEVFSQQLKTLLRNICVTQHKICASLMDELSGRDTEEFEREFILTLIGHYPTSTSRKNTMHAVQNSIEKKIRQFDYGLKINMEKYGQKVPPYYNLKKVTMKIALYAGKNDKLTPVKNVSLLKEQLPNVVEYRIMKRKEFNHIDHVWGKNMDKYLFPHVLRTLKNYV